MKTAKIFTVIGHSVRNGTSKVRLSAGQAEFRGKVLLKTGNTSVILYNLPYPMPKADANEWLTTQLPTGIKPAFQG